MLLRIWPLAGLCLTLYFLVFVLHRRVSMLLAEYNKLRKKEQGQLNKIWNRVFCELWSCERQ